MNAITRIAAPSHQQWVPLPYMERAAEFLAHHYSAGLPLKPGGRKTSITLAAFEKLRQRPNTGVRTMLVVAPLRVCRQVWRQEGQKWSQFRHLNFALVVGDAKARAKALKSGADIYLINYENLEWLAKQYMGRSLPFDIVAFDELTKMMNATAVRHKAVRPRLQGVKYRWGLTGSLFAKGHMNIFGQQLILDDGAALGRFITHYRDTYFSVGFNGFDYNLIPGAERRIIEKLAPYWFYMDDKDYSQLPPLIDVPHIGDLEPTQRGLYDRMKRNALISIGAETITAANAGAVYSKLAQLANGAVYRDGHTTSDEFEKVHDLKLDMLEELLDELDGEPLLVAYEFQHDMLRIQERFGKRFPDGKVPYLGAGTTHKLEDKWVLEWNQRKLPLLCAHPQSAGHGLNMQEGQAYNVAWFSVSWDWELYDQFIRRVRRSGNTQTRIFNHLLIVKGTIDEEKLESVSTKDFTERRLLTALNTQILAEGAGTNQETTMVTKLSRPQGEAGSQGGGAAGWGSGSKGRTAADEAPRGRGGDQPETERGAPAGWGGTTQNDSGEQRERIRDQIAPQGDRSAGARSAFSGGVQDDMTRVASEYDTTGDQQQEERPPNGWGGGTKAAPFDGGTEAAPTDKPARRSRAKPAEAAPAGDGSLIAARAEVLSAVIGATPDADVGELIEITRELMAFVEQG